MDAFFRLGLSCVFTQAHVVAVDDGDDDHHSQDFMDEFLEITSKLDRGRMLHGYHLSLSLSLSFVSVFLSFVCIKLHVQLLLLFLMFLFLSSLWNSVY